MIIASAVWLPSLWSNTTRKDENFKIFINSLVDEEIISNQNRLRILQSQTLFFLEIIKNKLLTIKAEQATIFDLASPSTFVYL